MKSSLTCLLTCLLCVASAHADISRVYHVIKARITTNTSTFTTYALIEGELNYYSDSLLREYKLNPALFTQTVNRVMSERDTMKLYSRIFRVQAHGLVLLPEDGQTKLARNQIKQITLLHYIPAAYTYKMIYTDVMSADSTWLSWKPAQAESFNDGPNGLCNFTALFFNKPDKNAKDILDRAKLLFSRLNHEGGVTEKEITHMRKLLRRARIIVYGLCTC